MCGKSAENVVAATARFACDVVYVCGEREFVVVENAQVADTIDHGERDVVDV